VVGKHAGTGGGGIFSFYKSSTGSYQLELRFDGTSAGVTTLWSPTLYEKEHIAITWDGTNAKIYKINSYIDFDNISKDYIVKNYNFKYIDFEEMSKNYDAIELTEKGVYNTIINRNCYRIELYGWDVASTIILNKDVIIPVKKISLKEFADAL
jgi:hypothetical protein